MAARAERRLQWWKENRKKVEQNEEEKHEDGTEEDAGKKKEQKKPKKSVTKEISTNVSKGFKSNLVKPETSEISDDKRAKKRKSKSEPTDDQADDTASEASPKKKSKSSDAKIEKALKPPKALESAEEKAESGESTEKGGKKYVLFIGNLPYRAQKHHLEKHFSKCHVNSIRLMTDKQTKRSRGFAYIELQNGKSFKKALLLHHSELLGRQINVEFTTIGGGKSANRAKKLKEKNARCERFKVLRPEDERYSKKDEG